MGFLEGRALVVDEAPGIVFAHPDGAAAAAAVGLCDGVGGEDNVLCEWSGSEVFERARCGGLVFEVLEDLVACVNLSGGSDLDERLVEKICESGPVCADSGREVRLFEGLELGNEIALHRAS